MVNSRIVWVDWDLAYTKDGIIYLHKELQEELWEDLRKRLIEHELKHYPGQWRSEDLEHDFTKKKPHFDYELWLFHLLNPKSLTQYNILNHEGKLRPQQALSWGVFLLAILVGWFLLP